ncbi:MAG: glutamate-5-semialdehyde dehydrogenase [Desulfovibrio sp.]
MNLEQQMRSLAQKSKEAARILSCADGNTKKNAILRLAELLVEEKETIFAENKKDLDAARERGLDSARLRRLEISEKVLQYMVNGCKEIAAMSDPIGGMESMTKRPNGMLVGKMRVPLGVICMIYESRPNVTVDSGILCLMSGNATILRGGSEAFHSNKVLAGVVHKALEDAGLPAECIQVLPTTDREAVGELLKLDEFIDVVIPRGGEGLIRAVVEQATMPVLKHYKGVCHIYVDDEADLTQAVEIIYNSKVQYPSGCNALECLLVHEDVVSELLPAVAARLGEVGVKFRADEVTLPHLGDNAEAIGEEDKGFEYLDLILGVRAVSGQDEAQDYISKYGSNHTEAILTEKYERALRFIREVDASLVVANAATRFNDGGQLGLGAEIGISTSKLHAYGPMGIMELTSSKYVLLGNGQVRE